MTKPLSHVSDDGHYVIMYPCIGDEYLFAVAYDPNGRKNFVPRQQGKLPCSFSIMVLYAR
jgi:hypothetical protein